MPGPSHRPIPRRGASTLSGRLALACLVLVASLALGATAALAGTARGTAEPGVTSGTILLGGTAPLSGLASPYASVSRGAEAYFKYVNARGGVNGRKIVYKVVDDAYNPAQSISVTRQLVEQDRVFAVFNSLGTSQNLAVRPYLNSMKVPQLFVASGATTWGRDYAQYPYTIGFQPSYQAEGWVYGKYLARTAPGATIAVLFQNDDYGKDLLGGLKRGLQRSKAKVIAAQPYDPTSPDVSSQIARLKSSGADTLAIFATPTFAVQAYTFAHKLGWKPKRVINNAVASASTVMLRAGADGQNKLVDNTISIALPEGPDRSAADSRPGDEALPRDHGALRAGRECRRSAARLRDGGRVDCGRRAEEGRQEPDARGLLKVLDTFTAAGNPFMIPGIVVKTAGKDHFPVEQMLLQRWQNGAWKSFGGLWGYRAS